LALLSWLAYWPFASSPPPKAECGHSIDFEAIFLRSRPSIVRPLERPVEVRAMGPPLSESVDAGIASLSERKE
jgi:hypothetical protein